MSISKTLLSRTFTRLADSLADEVDFVDLLTLLGTRCRELFDADAAGVLLADDDGNLRVVMALDEHARLLEQFQLESGEGPSLECFSAGAATSIDDVEAPDYRASQFGDFALAVGYRAVHSFPLRFREVTIGTLDLFMGAQLALSDEDKSLGQALADVVTATIVQNQAVKEAATMNGHLQRALSSRIAIEQAKGILAERFQLEMGDAFNHLRRHARNTNQRLSDVATAVVEGRLTLDAAALGA